MARTLAKLVDYLERLTGQAPVDELRGELAELFIDWAEIASFVRFADKTYRRNLVRAGPAYNLWVLCWRNGQRSPIHDHRGSSCAVRVLQGTLTETLFVRAANGLIKATGSRDFEPGQVVSSLDSDIHQVSNLQAGKADLVTLHAYSPPLAVMGTYSLVDDVRGEEPMLLDFYDAAGI
jgi:cysteine dioxygenase